MATMYTTLISPEQLKALQGGKARVMVFDCTFDLMDPTSGESSTWRRTFPAPCTRISTMR
jgi:thiosulfate/3-mercaptopyruvate sulfurtransferase